MLRFAHRIFQSLFFDPLELLGKFRGLPLYLRDAAAYSRAGGYPATMAIRAGEAYPVLAERFSEAGSARGHYFFQDLWAARKLKERQVKEHVDVGSRVDGFVAHALAFAKVVYVDIRPLGVDVEGLEFRRGSILEMPFETGSVSSLSCLHVIEHIGLGRYGDPVDPQGHVAAAKELSRVLAPGGTLLLGVPVGRERLCFNAHRIFDPQTVASLFPGLKLKEFSLVDDVGRGVTKDAELGAARACSYGCGLFEFVKQ